MWQPTASILNLQKRAELLRTIRQFFYERGVLEVETPLMAGAPVTDACIQALETLCKVPGGMQTFYLQTSPEYAMKRLLASGSGSIYQFCKAFRSDESGRRHNPEFTMLEWYRVGFTDQELMQEVDALLQLTLHSQPAQYISYQAAFVKYLNINPHTIDDASLSQLTQQHIGLISNYTPTRNDCLDLLFSKIIEPSIGQSQPAFVYHYPVSQAALARRRIVDGVEVAARFEVYYQGMELANAYYELTDAREQRKRFENDLKDRERLGLPIVPIDEKLMAAMQYGLPDCAGIALGFDRLCMLALGATQLSEVISFSLNRA